MYTVRLMTPALFVCTHSDTLGNNGQAAVLTDCQLVAVYTLQM